MRSVIGPIGAALLLSVSGLVPTHAADGLDEPVKLVRTLQVVQDQIAHGTLESESARRTLIDTIGARLIAAPPETWRDPHNVDAAILYALSGGNPAVLAKPPSGDDAAHQQLVAAVRAYAVGSEEEAKKLWAPIDIGTLPIGLVGPAALAKATLLMADDPKQAMQFVDIARLEAPGTLIEEAAVRRGIEIAAKLGDGQKFEFFAIRYASRFPRSMYAEAFRERFSEFYLTIAAGKDDKVAPKLDTILAPLAKDDRREIFLEIARLAIIDAKIALGQSAAENALALSGDGTVEKRRAELYQAAALAVGDDPAKARVELNAAGEGDLPERDRQLLGAALAVVDQVEHWPDQVNGTEPPAIEGLEDLSDGAVPAADVIAHANDAVAAAKRLLADIGGVGG